MNFFSKLRKPSGVQYLINQDEQKNPQESDLANEQIKGEQDQLPVSGQPVTNESVDIQSEEPSRFKFSNALKRIGGAVKNNMDLILPAAFSATSGMGVLPGLMSAYSARGNQMKLREQLEAESAETAAKIKQDQAELEWKANQNEQDRKTKLDASKIIHSDNKDKQTATEKERKAYIKSKSEYDSLVNEYKQNNMSQEEAQEAASAFYREKDPETLTFINDYEKRNYLTKQWNKEMTGDTSVNTNYPDKD